MAERAPAPAHYRCPFGCLPTAWPGDAAWCRAALGRGLAVVWLYERPGLAFPYPLRVHPVRCLPAAWLHSSVATSKPLVPPHRSAHQAPVLVPRQFGAVFDKEEPVIARAA